ncbi:MAG: phosphate signaling complex protein PhoU [archaeon]|nr:phosphate signaling complex protein PhoU [archaeon]MCP8313562.1 phosphate signaling complex protein PhoU [archaeon]
MARLLDLGMDKLTNMILDMAGLSEKAVATAIQAYTEGRDVRDEVFKWSEALRFLQDEVSELAIELIARYQPVASDLRFIKSSMEITYGLSRFGRYAYDITTVLYMFGDLSKCDHSTIINMADKVKVMIYKSIEAFIKRDVEMARTLSKMDDEIDNMYKEYVKRIIENKGGNLRCSISATLILRYLERIADHANSIGDKVVYIVIGESTPRR